MMEQYFECAGVDRPAVARDGRALHRHVRRGGNRLRAHEPRQGAPARYRVAALSVGASHRRHAPRGTHALVVGRPGRRWHCRARRRREPARRDARARGRSAPAAAVRRARKPQRARRLAAAVGGGDRRSAARGRRHRSRRHLRGRPGVARLRQLRRPAQLARDHRVQSAVEPVSPHRQGGENRLRRVRVGFPGVRAQDGAGARAARADRPSFAQRSRPAAIAPTSRRRRWRRSPRRCAGADSPRAR